MKIHGKDVDQKFKSVETALNRLAKKIKPTTAGIVPPVPVSYYKDTFDDMVIGRYIFPASGEITKLVVYLTFEDKKTPVVIDVAMEINDSSTSHSFKLHNPRYVESFHLEVPIGARLSFSLREKPEGLEAIWLGFLYKIRMSHTDVYQLALEQMEAIDERNDSAD